MKRAHCVLRLAPSLVVILVMVCGSAMTKQMSDCAPASASWTSESATSRSTWSNVRHQTPPAGRHVFDWLNSLDTFCHE